MKLKKLNKALVAAGLVAGATISMPTQAVTMSDDGTGEVLMYPFYTVQGPQDAPRATIFTLTNTTSAYKAVKVRFHEAHNSRDALDFNVYLSPDDVWTAAITRSPTGVAQLTTTDKSCTLPTSIMNSVNTFSTAAYTQDTNNDGGNQNGLRTNEGYIEVIEMGEIGPAQNIIVSGADAGDSPLGGNSTINTLGEAILHINNVPGGGTIGSDGIPDGCKALEFATAANGVWQAPVNSGSLDNAHIAVTQPTGGLSGSAYILQASLGTVSAYNAIALKNFYDVAGGAACNGVDLVNNTYCETNGQGNAAATTNRAFDDLHSFKDLDPSTANARSIQTYPNLAMAFPQISTVYNPDAGIPGRGAITTLEWSDNQSVSTGVTTNKANTLFAALRDLNVGLNNDANPAVNLSTLCGGNDGVQAQASAQNGICGNARPVSAVLAKSNVSNEYVLEQEASSGVDFRTDIVITFPTKWYFTDNGLYKNDVVVDDSGTAVSSLENINLKPFSSQFVSSGSNRDQACERFSINEADVLPGGTSGQLFNREEDKPNVSSTGLVPSPAINVNSPEQNICHESNVLTLNDGDLLSSRIANGLDATVDNSASGTNSFNIDFPAGFESGRFTIAFDTDSAHNMTSVSNGPMNAGPINYGIANATMVKGLPAIGFVVEGLISGASGFDGNFTIGLPHYQK